MPGRLYGDALLAALNTFDLGVSPDVQSPYTDASTMNKILEYMAFGLPLVQFDLVENRVSAGDAAIHVAPGNITEFADAIERLCRDPEWYKIKSLCGTQRMQSQLGWHHQRGNLIEMYSDLLCLGARSSHAVLDWSLQFTTDDLPQDGEHRR